MKKKNKNEKYRLVILHARNTFNYGSFMMGINFIYYFSKKYSNNSDFFVHCLTKEDYYRYIEELDNEISLTSFGYSMVKSSLTERNESKKKQGIFFTDKIKNYVRNRPKLKQFLLKIFSYYFLKKEERNWINSILQYEPDGVIILGGDDLSEYYSGPRIINYLKRLKNLNKKIIVFLIGQTIGPFHPSRRKVAAKYLSGFRISLRDEWSLSYAKNILRLPNVFISSDLAFLPLPAQNNKRNKLQVMEQYNLQCNQYITIIPSGLYHLYCSNREVYIKCWIKLLDSLAKNPKTKNYSLILLAHVIKPENSDDRQVIKEVFLSLKQGTKDKVRVIYDELLPSQARKILGQGKFSISARMHGAISTLQMGKPAISVSYSVKYQGVIGKSFGMPELVIEANNSQSWESEEIVTQLIKKVNWIEKNYSSLCQEISDRSKQAQEKAMLQIEWVAKELVKGDC